MIYFQNTCIMGVFVGSMLLLISFVQSSGKRVTFSHKPVLGKVCWSFSSMGVKVRDNQFCHWHCMQKPAYVGVNYHIPDKTCWLLTRPCANIIDSPVHILTVYGSQEYVHRELHNYAPKPLVGKACKPFSSIAVKVRDHRYCHWHCMETSACIGVNFNIRWKECWLLTMNCTSIIDFLGNILTLYGTQEYVHGLLLNQ